MAEDSLDRGLALLNGLRENVPEKDQTLGSEWVDMYHAGLDHIEKARFDVAEFSDPRHGKLPN